MRRSLRCWLLVARLTGAVREPLVDLAVGVTPPLSGGRRTLFQSFNCEIVGFGSSWSLKKFLPPAPITLWWRPADLLVQNQRAAPLLSPAAGLFFQLAQELLPGSGFQGRSN